MLNQEGRALVGRILCPRLLPGKLSPREFTYLAVDVDTELELHSLVPADVGVRLGLVAQHALWRQSKSPSGMSTSVALGKCLSRISPRALLVLCCAG